MNNLIGPQSTMILVVLLALNASIFLIQSYYLEEEKKSAERQLQSINSETQKLKTETSKLKKDTRELLNNLSTFETLLEKGGINNQNRVTVRDSFSLMASVTQLINADYSVSSADELENIRLSKADHNLLKSTVNLQVSAIDDVKIYKFLYLIANKFPGITNIKSINVEKTSEVTADALRSMNSENPEPLVSGTVEFDWISVTPVSNNSEEG